MPEDDPKDWLAFIVGALATLLLIALPFALIVMFLLACESAGRGGW